MAGWLTREQFATQLESGNSAHVEAAACPADFSEGASYWISEYPIDFEDECRDAALPSDVDVVIIGSGITAAAVLHNIANEAPGRKVAVLEARGICTGATGRNGGHLCRAEGTDFRELIQAHGQDEAIRLLHLGTRNRDLMLAAIERLGIAEEVDLRLNGTRVVFASKEERETYLAEKKHIAALGISIEGYFAESNEVSKACNISADKAQFGAACIDNSGTVYPRKLVAALFRDARKRMARLTIRPFTPVRSVEKHQTLGAAPLYNVKTDQGSISASVVVHATNAYASYLIPSLKGVDGVIGCKAECIAIQPNVPGSESSGLRGGLGFDEFWHWLIQRPNNGPFIYGWSGVEMVGDYNDSNVLPTDDNSNPAGHDVMGEFLETAFPACFSAIDWGSDVLYRWTGIQGFTTTGSSLVGRYSQESAGEFISVGHNGEGMGRCFASATVMTDRLLHYLDGKDEEAWSAPGWFPKSFLRNI